jgi:hypothetical protein
MKIKRNIIALPAAAILLFTVQVDARENGANGHRNSNPGSTYREASHDQLAASCTPAAAKTDLDINNVRTTIMTGGDMWWDLQDAQYEVPKGGAAHSIFAGALWIGGLDAGGQLKVAAMTYRQTGNDFWPGPLDTTTVSIDGTTCNAFDKHWKIKREEVEQFVAWVEDPTSNPTYAVPLVIQTWPGNGDPSLGQGRYLAPFVDVDGDAIYNYAAGDYPAFDLTGELGCDKFQVHGDQCLWWVFNDKGNIHSETGAASIGLEIHAQAFAFATNDEINNMTFYTYKIINRSTVSMEDTYFGQWTDADLGEYQDDYVGCDVARGLGYTYNGDNDDGSSSTPAPGTYGANPPAIGMDFFEGPVADPGDGIDNDRDGILDEPGEQIIMSKFVYYDNDFSIRGNPENATHFYNYLSGFWKDGTPFTYGGNAYGGTDVCNYMFPGDPSTDPDHANEPWSEASVNNTPADRRMMQSAGPFTLQPGAVNYITVGAVWARASSGGPAASVELMRATDDKAQRLFDNCFRTLDGPDAPDLTIQELDKELVIYMTNDPNSNNFLEQYEAYDPSIVYASIIDPAGNGAGVDTTYNFEGYQVFQLKDATVTTADLYDLDKARLVKQFDVRNGVTTLVNREFDQALNADVPKDMTLTATDEGVQHSFTITEDAFASGDRRLINHKTYYFMVLAYAHNTYLEYDDVTFDPNYPTNPSNIGQKKPYLAGRRNVNIYKAIPHIPSPETYGTVQNSSYGSGPKITRLEGSGNGGNILDLTQSSEDAIVAAPPIQYDQPTGTFSNSASVEQITYENGHGPISVKVVDPLNVPEGEFTVKIVNNPNASYTVTDTAKWVLTETTSPNRTWNSESAISLKNIFFNEQIIPELGLSITVTQVSAPGYNTNPDNNGYLESSMTFADPLKPWLAGVEDNDGLSETNWIRSGSFVDDNPGTCSGVFNDADQSNLFLDPNADYENIINRTWAPYRLVAPMPTSSQTVCYSTGPGYNNIATSIAAKMEYLASVNVVFTNDRSKWTRVPVFEVGANPSLNEGLQPTWKLRAHASVDKYGSSSNTGGGLDNSDFISSTGMSWFPGYAINVETGERLNMAFGENSGYVGERGRDMLWNPTANERSTFYEALFGGQHYLYVFGHNSNMRFSSAGTMQNALKNIPAYDYGAAMVKIVRDGLPSDLTYVFRDAMWVNVPLLAEDFSTWNFDYAGTNVLPCDVKVRLRVAKPYKRALTATTPVLLPLSNPTSPWLASDTVFASLNGNNPMYKFDTKDLKVVLNDDDAAQNAIDLINVVPNPYYAFSGYETSQLDNRVKFTNLPVKCTIQIYTVSGTLVRKMTKDSPQTSLDWDLKNQAGIPIASGLYIIYVDVKDADGNHVGEKILKWFGVLRPIDLDAY